LTDTTVVSKDTASMRFSCVAIVPAGGSGARFGATLPKQYALAAGKTVLEHSLLALLSVPTIERVYLVVQTDDEWAKSILETSETLSRVRLLACAGATRSQTVSQALAAIRSEVRRDARVLVHDAARPCVSRQNIESLIDVAGTHAVGGLLALPIVDTIKRSSVDGQQVETVSREGLWRAQTPQLFRYETLAHALATSPDATDESQAIEALGLAPVLVHGDPRNIKITVAADLDIAEFFLQDRSYDNSL
jgi:2-C-methyl-D-erythritol 4-phosphate cytidylyltransferase